MLPLVPFHIYKYALYIFFATKERWMTLPPFLYPFILICQQPQRLMITSPLAINATAWSV